MTSHNEWHTGNQEGEDNLTLNSEIERGLISSQFILQSQEIIKNLVKQHLKTAKDQAQNQDRASCPEPEAPGWGVQPPKDTKMDSHGPSSLFNVLYSTLQFVFSVLPLSPRVQSFISYSFFLKKKTNLIPSI